MKGTRKALRNEDKKRETEICYKGKVQINKRRWERERARRTDPVTQLKDIRMTAEANFTPGMKNDSMWQSMTG